MIKLYNTLGRKIEDFKPQSPDVVKLYTCGPTVYDYSHIGNLRAYIFFDTLRRTLEVAGYKIKHVMNITDVGHLISDEDAGEDKLEKGAIREGKTVWEVADFYIKAFLTDVAALNILPPNYYKKNDMPYARATDFIREQIEIVQILIDKGFAYQTREAIYFDVTRQTDYGKLSGQNLSDKEVAVRAEVVTDPDKRNPHDFAVWFFTVGRFEKHSMRWVSPWGDGFPGWHLECSAIIHSLLQEPIDIHTGGVDHIGTHHTNEIAQSEAAFGTTLANYWVHNEHLLVNGHKMSKSEGNFYTLSDITKKNISPKALRMLFLQSHYRSQLNFFPDSLSAAQKNLLDLQAFADLRHQQSHEATHKSHKYFTDIQNGIEGDLFNDLATPNAIAKLSLVVSEVTALNNSDAEHFNNFLRFLDNSLGFDLLSSEDISASQKQLIDARETARSDKDWEKADEIRSKLLGDGIELKDFNHSTIWKRVRL